MANLPTAYASQRFGRKTLDFYAVEGEVAGADPRARADERRLQDIDGARHTIRLMESGFELDRGQTATVLRMQPGPARRSRPVAVINHDTGAWCRTHPGVEGLLAKAGVSRTFNWGLTMALFALAAFAVIWPFLRAFLVEVDPSLFGQAPDLNVAELAAGALPALTGWSFSDAVAPISGPLGEAAPALAGFADGLVFGVGVLIAALGVYLLRSWRLLWAPLFVGSLGAVSLGYGGVAELGGPALSGLAIAAFVFLLGGVINRVRDSARLEARIAVLADHLLRQGPQDAVAPAEAEADAPAEVRDDAEPVEALGPAAAAAAASLREPGDAANDFPPDAEDASADAADGEAGEEALVREESAEAVDPAAAADLDTATEAEAEPESEPTKADATPPVEAGNDGDAAASDAAEADDAIETANTQSAAEEGAVGDGDAAEADQPSAGPAEATADPEGDPAADAGEAAPAAAPEAQGGDASAAQSDTLGAAAEGKARDSADISSDVAPAGLDPEEAERLRNDPRYASRAIVLPPPPPMPEPTVVPGEGSGEAVGQRDTQTLRPNAPLPDNVIPIFAAPASSEITPSAAAPETPAADAPKDD